VKTITITREADDAIRSATQPGYEFKDNSTHNPDGTFTIPLADDTIANLNYLSAQWGLSISDVIIRAITSKKLS
jgi:hypothetical protein